MTSKEKIRDIKSVINEFYHNEKCEGRLTECARKSWLLFQEYCDDILQDLERLEALEEENKELNNIIEKYNDLNIQSFFIRERERDEIKQLKKAIEILKMYNLTVSYIPEITRPHLSLNDYGDGVTLDINEYELLKEVLGE